MCTLVESEGRPTFIPEQLVCGSCCLCGGSGVLVLCLGRFLSVGSCGRELGVAEILLLEIYMGYGYTFRIARSLGLYIAIIVRQGYRIL